MNLNHLASFFIFGSIPAVLTENISHSSRIALLQWWTSKAAALALTFIIWDCTRLILRGRIQTTIWQLMLIGAFGGALGGSFVYWMAELFLLDSSNHLGARVFSAALLGALWLPILSTFNNSIERFNFRVIQLRATLLAQHQIQMAQSQVFKFFTDMLHNSLAKRLNLTALEAQEFLRAEIENPKLEKSLHVLVTEIATTTFRDLSHSLLKNAKGSTLLGKGKNSLISITKEILSFANSSIIWETSKVLDPAKYSLVMALLCASSITRHATLITALISLVIIYLSNFCILKIHSLLEQRALADKSLLLISSVIGTAILPPLALLGIELTNNSYLQISNHKFELISYAVIAVAVSFAGLVSSLLLFSSTEFEAALNREIQSGQNDEFVTANEISRITKIWSQHIHGNIQGPLIILASKLEKAEIQNDLISANRHTNEIFELLQNSTLITDSRVMDLKAEVLSKCTLWDGLMDVSVDFDLGVYDFIPYTITSAAECIEELLTNAFRHGKANIVNIQLFRSQLNSLQITCSDNGHLVEKASAGLGFELFNNASSGNWSINRDTSKNQTIVKVSVPC